MERTILYLLFLVTLTACGGGGGGSDSQIDFTDPDNWTGPEVRLLEFEIDGHSHNLAVAGDNHVKGGTISLEQGSQFDVRWQSSTSAAYRADLYLFAKGEEASDRNRVMGLNCGDTLFSLCPGDTATISCEIESNNYLTCYVNGERINSASASEAMRLGGTLAMRVCPQILDPCNFYEFDVTPVGGLDALVASVAISPALTEVEAGDVIDLAIDAYNAAGDALELEQHIVQWSSTNPNVAVVDGYQIRTLAEGITVINLIVDGIVSNSLTIEVSSSQGVSASYELVYTSNAMMPGALQSIYLESVDDQSRQTELPWASSNPTVVSIDTNGALLALSPGDAEVFVEYAGQRHALSVSVAAENIKSLRVDVPDSLEVGELAKASLIALSTADIEFELVMSAYSLRSSMPEVLAISLSDSENLNALSVGEAAVIAEYNDGVTVREVASQNVQVLSAGETYTPPSSLLMFSNFNNDADGWTLVNTHVADGVLKASGEYDAPWRVVEGGFGDYAAGHVEGFNYNSFTIAASVKPETQEKNTPLIVGGQSRWLSVQESWGTWYLVLNNYDESYQLDFVPTFGAFNQVVVRANLATRTISVKIGGDEQSFVLPEGFEFYPVTKPQGPVEGEQCNDNECDSAMMFTNYSSGYSLKGEVDWVLVGNDWYSDAELQRIIEEFE